MAGNENTDGSNNGKRPDIRDNGMRDTSIAVLLNIPFTHIIEHAMHHKSQPHPGQGNVVCDDTINQGMRYDKDCVEYKAGAAAVYKEFIPLVMDTYGRMYKPSLILLKEVATHSVHRATGNVIEQTQAI